MRSVVELARTGKQINILKKCYFTVIIINEACSGGLKIHNYELF